MASAERAVREGLADALLCSPARAAAVCGRLEEQGLLQRTIALAGAWRVVPALRARCDRGSLRRLHTVAAAHAALTVHRSAGVLQLLQRHGVDGVAIKGIAVIAGLYERPAARMVSDLDVVVRERDFARTACILEDAGYVSVNPPFTRHVADIGASVRLHNFSRTFVRDGHEVDVHWRFGPRPPDGLDADAIVASARAAVLGTTPIRVATPVVAMLLCVHHALRGYFSPRTTLKDLLDLAAWWTLGRDAWDLDDVIVAAKRAGLASSLLAMWQIVAARDPAHPAAEGACVLAAALNDAQRRESAGVVRFFERQLALGDCAPRTIEVFALPLFGRWWAERARRRFCGNRSEPGPYDEPAARRAFLRRAAGFSRRTARVVRELADVRCFAAYRAVARAQRRYH